MAAGMQFPSPAEAHYLRDVYDKIQRNLKNDRIDTAMRLWASDQLEVAQPLLDQALRGDEGLEMFLATHLKHERAKWEARQTRTPLSETPYERLRTDPLCTCSDGGCHAKAGAVPSAIANASDPLQGVRDYVRGHGGIPVVLVGWPDDGDDGGALGAFAALRGRAQRFLRGVDIRLTTDQDGEPDADPAAAVGLRDHE
jgi:hypothetical protein